MVDLRILDQSFFIEQKDPVLAARSLLGKLLWVRSRNTESSLDSSLNREVRDLSDVVLPPRPLSSRDDATSTSAASPNPDVMLATATTSVVEPSPSSPSSVKEAPSTDHILASLIAPQQNEREETSHSSPALEELPSDVICCGQIIETEGYCSNDLACHARLGRRTPTVSVLFESGGKAYVYSCHMHMMLNISFAEEEVVNCVLIRSIAPVANVSVMASRRTMHSTTKGFRSTDFAKQPWLLGKGPGNLTLAMGIDKRFYGCKVYEDSSIWITEAPKDMKHYALLTCTAQGLEWVPPGADSWATLEQQRDWVIASSPRIGIASAGKDAMNLWRFYVKDHRGVSTGPMIWPDDMAEERTKKRKKIVETKTPPQMKGEPIEAETSHTAKVEEQRTVSTAVSSERSERYLKRKNARRSTVTKKERSREASLHELEKYVFNE